LDNGGFFRCGVVGSWGGVGINVAIEVKAWRLAKTGQNKHNTQLHFVFVSLEADISKI
jgi:hypothetical protein